MARAQGLVYPPDGAERVVLAPVSPAPVMARPGYLAPYRDPVFHTSVERVTDRGMGPAGVFGGQQFIRHAYALQEPWNSDGSYFLLGDYVAGGLPLLDGRTFRFLGIVKGISQPRWSNLDPDTVYGFSGTDRFISENVVTGQMTTLHVFNGYSQVTFLTGKGSPDDADHYVAFVGTHPDGSQAVITYDMQTGAVVATLDHLPAGSVHWAGISQSGAYVLIQWIAQGVSQTQPGVDPRSGVDAYTRTLQFVRQLTPGGGHGDLGVDGQGNDVFVHEDSNTGKTGIYSERLDTTDFTQQTIVLGPVFTQGHVSCQNIRRPGWCYVSSSPLSLAPYGSEMTEAVRLDGSGVVEPFAYEFQTLGLGTPSYSYKFEAEVVPDPDGTRVVFASDWDGTSTSPVYDYVASAAATAPAPPSAAPLSITIISSRPLVDHRRTALRLACATGRPRSVCRGTLSLTIRVRRRVPGRVNGHPRKVTITQTIVLAQTRYTLKSGHSKLTTLLLDHAALARLARARGHRLRVAASATLRAGQTTKRTITLQPERPRTHRPG